MALFESSRAWSYTLFVSALLVHLSSATWDINNPEHRHGCQCPSLDPLEGCDRTPGRTLFVDGEGGKGFESVQAAVEALPNNTDAYTILIASGNYTGQVNITRSGPTYLLGQTYFPLSQAENSVTLLWSARAVPGLDNAFTSTLTIAPNLNASLTGAGPTGNPVLEDNPFGCVDFRAYNLDVVNNFAPYAANPALALSISYANGGFYYTGFYSYQDTVYVGKLGNAYFAQSEIAGQTDFLYGFGTCWVTRSSLKLRSCGGGIAAWKGTNTTFANKYGVYIVDSDVRVANSSLNITGKCALGRPWNSLHRSIFARTYLDASILPAGYVDWTDSTPRYSATLTLQAEYGTYGPGVDCAAREASRFGVQLSEAQWEPYSTPGRVFQDREGRGFGESVGWVDWGV